MVVSPARLYVQEEHQGTGGHMNIYRQGITSQKNGHLIQIAAKT
jgi:predicted small secreted protein